MKLSKVHVIITSGLTQTSDVFWFGKKYISEFCLRVNTSTVNWRRLAYAPFEFYFQHLRNHLASGARSLTNMSSMWNPPSPYLLTFWHFTLWHEKRFFRKWMGYNRCIQALPFFLDAWWCLMQKKFINRKRENKRISADFIGEPFFTFFFASSAHACHSLIKLS